MTLFIFSEVMFFGAFFGALFFARVFVENWLGGWQQQPVHQLTAVEGL